jgi:TolA-binding protein
MIDRRAIKPISLACALFALTLAAPPAFAVNKDMVQLQTEVQDLQSAVARLQQTTDERMGALRDLVQQSTDSVNKMTLSVETLQKNLSAQQEASGGKVDQVSNQVQALTDSLDEVKARLNSIDKALQAVQGQQQSINAALQNLTPPANAAPATNPDGSPAIAPGGAPQQATPQAPIAYTKPSADVPFPTTQGPYANAPAAPSAASAVAPVGDLYKTAYNDYMAARTPLAIQEFGDVIHAYPNDPLAGNAYFYLGEIDYHGNKFSNAVRDYNHVLDQYPGNQKIPAAHLHKAMALLQMKERDNAILEFRALIQRFPNSNEAVLARSKLNGMGVRASAPRNE